MLSILLVFAIGNPSAGKTNSWSEWIMEKLRTQVIDGRRILFPPTKLQKDIYKAFDVQLPV